MGENQKEEKEEKEKNEKREKQKVKRDIEKKLNKLKESHREEWLRQKGLVEIHDPYVSHPLVVYEHTQGSKPGIERKLLFKYPNQIRGKQKSAYDVYNEE